MHDEHLLRPTQTDDPKLGMILQDRYRIVRLLGEGGMGAVYEGEHLLIKKRVAIKCLHAHYALTLLLAPDIAWVADGLQRDGEQVRGPVTQMLIRELAALTQPVSTVTGQGSARLHAAIEAVTAYR